MRMGPIMTKRIKEQKAAWYRYLSNRQEQSLLDYRCIRNSAKNHTKLVVMKFEENIAMESKHKQKGISIYMWGKKQWKPMRC